MSWFKFWTTNKIKSGKTDKQSLNKSKRNVSAQTRPSGKKAKK